MNLAQARREAAILKHMVDNPGQAMGELTTGSALTIAAVGGVVVLVGWLMYQHSKRMDVIAAKEGSGGLLRYQAGSAAISIGSQLAAEVLGGRVRRNGRRRRS